MPSLYRRKTDVNEFSLFFFLCRIMLSGGEEGYQALFGEDHMRDWLREQQNKHEFHNPHDREFMASPRGMSVVCSVCS